MQYRVLLPDSCRFRFLLVRQNRPLCCCRVCRPDQDTLQHKHHIDSLTGNRGLFRLLPASLRSLTEPPHVINIHHQGYRSLWLSPGLPVDLYVSVRQSSSMCDCQHISVLLTQNLQRKEVLVPAGRSASCRTE